jgi:phosphatidylserine decarboxylase
MKIARGGLLWIGGVGLVTLACAIVAVVFQGLLQWVSGAVSVLGVIGVVLLVVFFRDPDRVLGEGVIAVADGVITEISEVVDPDVGACVQLKTFLNIYNVHVNRCPVDGTVLRVEHQRGGHRPAFSKESDVNERVTTVLESPVGRVKVVQIAGAVARRIVPYIKVGDRVQRGDRFGLIRLGSRVDVFLPKDRVRLVVRVRDRVKAGEDSLAEVHA